MAQTDLVCSKCVGRRTVNNIMMKANSKVLVTAVPPDQPLAYTRRPIFVSASVHSIISFTVSLANKLVFYFTYVSQHNWCLQMSQCRILFCYETVPCILDTGTVHFLHLYLACLCSTYHDIGVNSYIKFFWVGGC
jgi:hypothetical protein